MLCHTSPNRGSLCPPPRCLEALLLGGRGPCVLADTAELPTLADIQLAHLKLRALCLPGERGVGIQRGPPTHTQPRGSADPLPLTRRGGG